MSKPLVSPLGSESESAGACHAPDAGQEDAEPIGDANGETHSASDLSASSSDTDEEMPPLPKPAPTIVADLAAKMLSPVVSLHGVAVPRPAAIAGFEILETVGRGGMGVVYKARDVKLNRVVALKMILAGAHAEPKALARFNTEAQAVARLQHANIVQIFEVGEQEGNPYFSMEFVESGSMAQKFAGVPQQARPSAQLMETLTRAVHFAHQQGIVHRDLKPANVLLTADGIPKIVDFGLAKDLTLVPISSDGAAARRGQTKTGEMMGTPSYMAPEQAGADSKGIGPSADVYALGAMLYEMLTGRPPFQGVTALDTLRQVQSVEPVRPGRLQTNVPRDLETICLKCLQKEPRRRYANAGALADDLRRFLVGEPILARPIPFWERAHKWAKRRPAAAALVGVTAVATVVLVIGVLSYNAVLRQAAFDLRLAVERAEASQQRAEQNAAEAREQKEAAERAWRNEAERGRAYRRLALTIANTVSSTDGIKLYQEALTVFEELHQKHPDDAMYLEDLALTHYQLGVLYHPIKGFAPAVAELGKARELQEQLAQVNSANTDYLQELGSTYSWLGVFHRDARDYKPADEFFGKALAIQEQLARNFPDDAAHQYRLSVTYVGLGLLYRHRDQPEQAETTLSKARDIQQALSERYPRNSDYQHFLSRSWNRLGDLFRLTGRLDEAENAYDKAVAVREKLVRDNPKITNFGMYLGIAYWSRGLLASDRGQLDAALDWYSQAVDRMEAVRRKEPNLTMNRNYLCRAYVDRSEEFHRIDRPDEASKDWNSAIKLDKKLPWDRRLERAAQLIRLDKHAPATAIAAALTSRQPVPAGWISKLARIYSTSAEAARRDEQLPEADRMRLADQYAARADELQAKAGPAEGPSAPVVKDKPETETDDDRDQPLPR